MSIDTAAIRAEGDELVGHDYDNFASAWHEELLDEIDALRAEAETLAGLLGEMTGRTKKAEARLAAVEAERDTWQSREAERTGYWHATIARAEAAEARLAAVEAERQAEQETWRPVMSDYLDERDKHVQTMKRTLAAEAKLAAVEALCMRSEWADWAFARQALAAARREDAR